MGGFKSPRSAQRFVSFHAAVYNTFNVQHCAGRTIMKGSASGDLICQLVLREGPIYRRFSRRVVSENLDANIDFHVESAIYLCAGLCESALCNCVRMEGSDLNGAVELWCDAEHWRLP